MRKLAETLPVWAAWAKDIKEFSSLGLAIIVGEGRNLSGYHSHRPLFKRLGLAVMDGGVRQGGLPKSAGADEWTEHGYNCKRRAQIWAICDDVMFRSQAAGVNKGAEIGPYAAIYYARKAYETANREDRSDGHVDRRARRHMTKVFLRDLWRAWKLCDAALNEVPLPLAA